MVGSFMEPFNYRSTAVSSFLLVFLTILCQVDITVLPAEHVMGRPGVV